MTLPVYLDNHATTRVDPRALGAMLPFFAEDYGNAASKQHAFGWRAEAAVELARRQVASLVGASPDEVIFTSGATESVNLALKGVVTAAPAERNHVITAATEHRAVLDTCSSLARAGLDVTVIPVDRFGLVDPDDVRRSITSKTILVSIMAANNEIGTVSAFEEIGRICRDHEVPYHTDATQAAGKIPLRAATADLLSLSAHKMYGPKGIGALVIRARRPPVRLVPLLEGGGHERGLRSGTLNVPAIVGFGVAAEIAVNEMATESGRISGLRDRLIGGLREALDEVRVNGHPESRLPNNASLLFPGANADRVMMSMKDIAVSSGSACSSALPGPSHVLQAIGLSGEESLCTIRFGLGRFTTPEEIEYAIGRVAEAVRQTRAAQRLTVMEQT